MDHEISDLKFVPEFSVLSFGPLTMLGVKGEKEKNSSLAGQSSQRFGILWAC